MASKVNTKFIITLGIAIAIGFTAVAYFAVEGIRKSGEDYIQLGDEAMSKGQFKEAIDLYGKAVFKDQRNGPWIRKWVEAMEKNTPNGRAAYSEAFGQYQRGLRALTEAEPTSYEVMHKWLDLQWEMTRIQINLRNLEGFITGVNDSMKTFQGSDTDRKKLLRYRGLAQVSMVQPPVRAESKPEELEQARKDLEGALEVNPSDHDALLGIAGIDLVLAERARARDDKEKAEQLVSAARTRVAKFVEANPKGSVVRVAQFNLDVQQVQADNERTVTVRELLQDRQPKIEELIALVLADDPAKLEVGTALQVASFAQAALPNPRNMEAAEQIMAHLLKAHPDDAAVLLNVADFEANAGKVDQALVRLQKVVELPERPLSLKGLTLTDQRSFAIQKQTDLAFRNWETATDQATKEAAAAQAKKYRDDLVARVGDTNNAVLSIDARLSLINGDVKGALTQLTRYNQQTNEQDPQLVLLQASLMERTGSIGAAKSAYERVLQLPDRNSHGRAYASLSKLASDAAEYPEALRLTTQALRYSPENAGLREQEDVLRQVVEGKGNNPTIKAVLAVQQLATGVDANPAKAAEKMRDEMAKDPAVAGDIRSHSMLIRLLLSMNDRDGAIAAIDAALAKFPSGTNHETLVKLKQNLSEADPVKAALERIDAAEVPELTKLLAKYEIYTTAPAADDAAKNRNIETARGFLAQAAKLSPEDPKVVDAQFEDALRREDKVEMTRLATLAESKNIDKVGGQFYRGRLQYVEEKFAEASQSLRNVVERDKLNASAWRLLGATYLRLNNANSAAEAFGKAIEIRPNDVTSVTAYLRSLIASGRLTEALEQARKSERMAASNAEFAELYLRLEQSAPGGNPERALKARQAIAESRPDDKGNLTDLAVLQMDQRRWDEAKATIEQLRGDEKYKDAVTELEARWYAKQGKFAEAEKVFDDAIAARPKDKLDESIYIAASNILNEAGQPDRAVAMLKKGLPIQRKEFMVIDRQLGDVLFQARRPLEAVEAYKRVLESDSKDDGNAVAKRVLEAYLMAKEYAKFDEMLASMGETAQTDATLLVLAAEAASEQGDGERAARLYDQAIAADQKNFITFMKRGEYYAVHANRLRDAMADFEQAARLAPSSVMPRRRLATLNLISGKPEQAAEEYRKALTIDPSDDAIRAELIDLHRSLGQDDAVVDLVDQAIKLKPDKLEWRLRGGQLMSEMGKVDRACDYVKPAWEMRKDMGVAIQYVSALVSRTPPDIRTANSVVQDPALKTADPMALHVLRGLIFHRDKKITNCDQEMAQALGKLEQTNPQRCELFMAGLETIYGAPKDQIAAFDRLQGRSQLQGWMPVHKQMLRLRAPETAEAAATELDKLATAAPDPGTRATIHQLLSQYCVGTQQFEKAVSYCRKVLEVDANNFPALNNAAFLLAKHLKQPSDALPMAEKAVEIAPTSPTALDTLGTVHLELKNCTKAEEFLKKAVDLSTSDNDLVPSMLHLAKAQDCLDRKADAQRLLERVRQRFEGNPNLQMQFGEDLKQITQEIDGR